MTGLDGFLADKREAMRAYRERIAAGEVQPGRTATSVTVDDRTGVRRIAARGHRLLSDSGSSTGGFDLGPSPLELMLGAIGSCLASTFLTQCAFRGIDLERFSIDVSATTNPRAGHPAHPDIPIAPTDLTVRLSVVTSASEEKVGAAFAAAEEVCTVSAMLKDGTITAREVRVNRPG